MSGWEIALGVIVWIASFVLGLSLAVLLFSIGAMLVDETKRRKLRRQAKKAYQKTVLVNPNLDYVIIPPGYALSPEMRIIKFAQLMAREKSLYEGPADGVVGPRTQQAVDGYLEDLKKRGIIL